MRKSCLLFGIIFTSFLVFGQSGRVVNLSSALFDKHNLQTATTLADTADHIYFGNQSFLGPFNNIRQFYAAGGKNVGTFTRGHFIGGVIDVAQSGQLISENRASLIYAYHQEIFNGIRVSLGSQVGFINPSFAGTQVVAGGNDIGFNLNMSLAINGEKWVGALAIKQLTSPQLEPLQQLISYQRHFISYIQYLLVARPDFELSLKHQGVFYPDLYVMRFKVSGLIYQFAELGVMASQRELAIDAGLPKIDTKFGLLKMSVAYSIPLGNIGEKFNSFQIHVGSSF